LATIDTGSFASDMEKLMDMLVEWAAQQNIDLVLTFAECQPT